MPTYVVLLNWTDRGLENVKGTQERVKEDEALRERTGVKIKDLYWTQGPYDLVAICEAPDDESISAAMLGTSRGTARTTTLRAFNREEFAKILERI